MSGAAEERGRLVRGLRRELQRRLFFEGERLVPGRAGEAEPARVAVPAPAAAPAPAPPTEPGPGTLTPAEPRAPAPAPGPAPEVAAQRELAQAAPDLAHLRQAVAACRACPLCETRTQTVFADGEGPTRVLFIGEAPGQREDEQGVPFVGPAGALLTDIIEKGMGLRRSEVVIANVLKCRPPGNRDPSPAEKARCTPFLDRQIELLDPELLITLGTHASQHVLQSDLSMGRLRGKVHQRQGRKVVATYHPAYLLRSPGRKKDCWQDIQLAMAELGLSKPAKR